MPKRVGVVLSGCGALDGSEVRETVIALLALERGGAETLCLAPDLTATRVVDHRTGAADGLPRGVLAEAARIARGSVRDLASVTLDDVDALVFPGGAGVTTVLSDYADKGVVCEVHPEVVRLLKAHMSTRRPLGFIGLAPILAARVLGPVSGVRLTLGPRGSVGAKHAAVMGADVRPCPVRDVVIDEKSRVVSTPGYVHDDAGLTDVAAGIEKLVRAVLSLATDRRPGPIPDPAAPPPPGPPAPRPRPAPIDPVRRPRSSSRR
jgi:enhancing lycopene biosynthesis protein 2